MVSAVIWYLVTVSNIDGKLTKYYYAAYASKESCVYDAGIKLRIMTEELGAIQKEIPRKHKYYCVKGETTIKFDMNTFSLHSGEGRE